MSGHVNKHGENVFKAGARSKRNNTPEFNRIAKKRRTKAKHDTINRKKNQKAAKR